MQRKSHFDAVRSEVEALKASLMESRDARQIADYYSQLSSVSNSGSSITQTSSSAPSGIIASIPGSDTKTLSYSLPGGAIAKLRYSPESSKSLTASPKPHPFNSSSSTPAFMLSAANGSAAATNHGNFSAATGGSAQVGSALPSMLTRQGTATSVATSGSSGSSGSGELGRVSVSSGSSSDKKPYRAQSATAVPPNIANVSYTSTISVVSAHSSSGSSSGTTSTANVSPPNVGNQHSTTAGGPGSTEKDLDDDVGGASGTLTYVTELDYQDLVEKTPGRPWPKVLNLRKISSVEENKASEKFKTELLALNVNMVKPADLVFHSLLGRGSSANVYQGVLYSGGSEDGSEGTPVTEREVAIKILNTSPTDLRSVLKAHKETMDELVVVQRVQSPHVVRLFGITIEPSICIVLEFCHKGSLYDVLCSDMELSWAQCLHWFREITLGTLALHSSDPVIVHRDLKSLNLLVDNQNQIKVADFGLSRLNEGSADQLATLSKMRGTYIYCAPEIYFGEPFTPLSDVYSIGIIFWELIVKLVTGHYQRPFAEYPAVSFGFQVVIMASRKGVRPTIPSCPKAMQALLVSMWNSSPKNRPSCEDLLVLLDHIEKEYEAHREEWDAGQNYVPELKDVQPPPIEFLGASALAATASAAQSGFGASSPISPSSSQQRSSAAQAGGNGSSNTFTSPRSYALSSTGSSSASLSWGARGSSAMLMPNGSAASPLTGATLAPNGNAVTFADKQVSAPKLRKTTKTSLPSFKGIFPAGKEKEKSSKRRSVGKQKPHFADMLTDAKLYKTMEAKLHKEHSVEYLHFWKAVHTFEQRFKDRTPAENLTDAKYIETLLESVSGDDRLIEQIKGKIEASNPEQLMFADIQGEVTGILKTKFLSLSD